LRILKTFCYLLIYESHSEDEMPEHTTPFEYDVAVSFATPDRVVAEELAGLLKSRKISVLFDEFGPASLWGKDPVDHLVNLYARKAQYCVLLFSEHYPLKRWTERERRTAQERALRDANRYILPVSVDDADVPGATQAAGFRDLRRDGLESVVRLLEGQLAATRNPSGPPPRSHDLRSGNVPSTTDRSDP
jgi:hypothetical protein